MRKIAIAAVFAAALAAAAPSQAAGVVQSNGLNVSAFQNLPSGAGFNLMASSYEEGPLGGPPTVSNGFACVGVSNGTSSDGGCGALTIESDPLTLTATVSGNIPGGLGTIGVNLEFTTTQVSTQVPYASVEVTASPARVIAVDQASRNGRMSGTIAGAFGILTVDDAVGSLFRYRQTTVSA